MPITSRNNCIYATLGICHSLWMTVWYARWNPPCITIETPMWLFCNVTSHYTPTDNVLNLAKNDSERSPAVCHILRAHRMGNLSRQKYICVVFETTEFLQHKIIWLKTISISYGVPLGHNVLCCQWGQWFIYGHLLWRH